MLGRLVNRSVIRNTSLPPEVAWGDVLSLLLAADLRLVNLECVISSRGFAWKPETKAFHFRAHPRAIDVLRAARIDCVTLANNHSLDYGVEALSECLTLLDRAGIRHAGAGLCMEEALAPAVLETPAARLGVIALTDNEPEWEVTETTPGVNYIAYDSQGLIEPYRTRITEAVGRARNHADFVIVSAHVGPNWGPPSVALRALAHDLLGLGADLYWGHSNHTPQGIELYKGKTILYSTGDFVDDYAVDPHERNDLSFLFMLEMEQSRIVGLRLHSVAIENFGVRLARGPEVAFLQERMCAKCAVFGSKVEFQEGLGVLSMA